MPSDAILDELVRQFADTSFAAYTDLLFITLGVAAALFSIQFAWDLGRWSLLGEVNLVGLALKKLILFLILYNLISLAPMWLPQIIEGFAFIGERLTGIGLSPSSILGQGLDLGFTFFNSWDRVLSLFVPFSVSGLRLGAALVIILAFGLLAVQLARVLIEVSLALGGLTVFLAFSGHRMTFGLVEGYLRYLLELGIKLFVLYLVIGVGQDLGNTWDEALQGVEVFFGLRLHLTILFAAILFALLGIAVPGQIASRIAGSFSLSGHNPLGDR